jgi:hypothetical protein
MLAKKWVYNGGMSIERPSGNHSPQTSERKSSQKSKQTPEIEAQPTPPPLHPAFTHPEAESHLDTASRVIGKGAENLLEKVPHSLIGDVRAKLERANLHLLNKPILGVYEKLYRWRSESAAKSEATFLAKKEAVGALEARLAHLDESTKTVQAGGLYNPKLAAKMDAERNALLVQIEKARGQQDAAHLKFEDKNSKKAHWDAKQKNLSNEVIAKVEQKTTPFVARFDALQEKRNYLEASMASLQKTREAGYNGIREFEAKLRDKTLGVGERALLKIKLDRIKDCIKRIDAENKSNKKEMLKAEAKLRKVNVRLGRWNVFKNEYARVGAHRRHAEAGILEKVVQEKNHASTYSHAPEPLKPAEEPAEAPEQKERHESFKTSVPDYLKKWNELYGTKGAQPVLEIGVAEFNEFMLNLNLYPPGMRESRAIEKVLEKFIESAVKNGRVAIGKEAMQRRFKKIAEQFNKNKEAEAN